MSDNTDSGMTGAQHVVEARRLEALAERQWREASASDMSPYPEVQMLLDRAHLHATLALVAATLDVAGVRAEPGVFG